MSKVTTEALVETVSKFTKKPKTSVRRIIKSYTDVVSEEARGGAITSYLSLVWLGDFKGGIEKLEPVQGCLDKAVERLRAEGHSETVSDFRAVLDSFQRAILGYQKRGTKVVLTGFGTFNEDGTFKKSTHLTGVKVTKGEGGRSGL